MELAQLTQDIQELVPLPKSYIRIQELVNDPDSELEEITQVIANDPGLTGRILRISNSAYMGLVAKVDTISRAVQVLGLNQVHDLALASAAIGSLIKTQCRALDIYDFWRRSVYCAITARLIAKRLRAPTAERLFVAGLLHETGNLILAFKAPELYTEMLVAAIKSKTAFATIQTQRLGFDYATISAELLRQWQLPDELLLPVKEHTCELSSLAPEHRDETAIIHVASIIARAAMWHVEDDEPVPNFDPVAAQIVSLDDENIESLMMEADSAAIEAMSLLLPDLKKSKSGTAMAGAA